MNYFKAWHGLKKLPRELWILSFATFVNRMGTMALPFLVLYLTRSLGFSAEYAGFTLAIYGVVALFAGATSGLLSDRIGALKMMVITLIASAVVLLFYPLAHSKIAVIIMTILFAVTNEAFRPSNLMLIGELCPSEHRKSAFALNRLAINLGMSLGPAVGGLIAQISFPMLFIIDGSTALLATIILIFSSFYSIVKSHEMKARPLKQTDQRKKWIPDAFFKDPSFRIFLLGIIPVAIVFFQHQSSMPLFLIRNLHFSESDYGFLFTINTLLIILLEVPLNVATAHWSHRRALALGSLLFALGFGSLAFVHSYLEVAATIVIWTFGEMILFPAMSAYVSEIAPADRHGEYMGLYMTAFSVAFILGPWAGTIALERYGATVLWVGTLLVGMVSVFILGFTKKHQKANVDSR